MKKKLAIIVILLVIATVILLNKKTTQIISINYNVTEYKIPIYLKLYNFYGRHLNYSYIVDEITENTNSNLDKVINISKWINNNVKRLPKDVEVIDSHPLTIVKRKLGTKEQFSDLLSVLLVYADVKSFFWVDDNNHNNVLTLFKLNGYWSIIDPYYGLLFLNSKKNLSSVKEIKNDDWAIYTLDFKEIEESNFKEIFNGDFDNIDQVKEYYKQINKLPTQKTINNTNIFELGGRAYTQSPLKRLRFIMQGLLK